MNPKVKTSIAVAVPVLLALATLIFHKDLSPYLQALALLLVASAAVLNVFHVSAGTVDVIQSLVAALTSNQAGAQPPAAMMIKARKIAKMSAAAATTVLVLGALLMGCKNMPASNQPTNLIAPGLACAEEIILDLTGSSDPNAISGACMRFGTVAVGDVVALAQTLLSQQPTPPTGSAIAPLTSRLQKIAAWKP